MKEENFASLEELYQKLLPALRTKKNEMIREKYLYITEDDIWHYLCKHIWKGQKALTLGIMVDDILNTDSLTIYQHKGEMYGTN